MSRGSIRYIDASYMYGQQVVDAPVSNPVIYGNFTKFNTNNKTYAERLNRVLFKAFLLLVVCSIVSYNFVS